ncbi:MAG: phosphate ABC transporter permease PstA [Aggregatilineales bacterium]
MTQNLPLPSNLATDTPLARRERAVFVRRQALNMFMAGLVTSLTVISVLILVAIVAYVAINGISSLNGDFFTQIPKPYGEVGGGIGQAIVGTLIMLVVGGLIAIPVGVATAVFLSEYGRGWFAGLVSFALDLLAELPSIVVGVFVWALLVRNITGYSGIAGAIALAVIMTPIIARSVEEILRLVPDTLREAALALGVPPWRVITGVVIPTVLPGMLTGIVLALARAAGETAPLLLTALGNSFFNLNLTQPMAAIPLEIYNYALSPYDDWHKKAWAATLILIAVVATFSGAVRFFTRRFRYDA